MKYNPDQIRDRVTELGPWFHNMTLGSVETAPDHFLGNYPAVKWAAFAHVVPTDLRGQTVLDVGCNAGFLFDRDEAARSRSRGEHRHGTVLSRAGQVCGRSQWRGARFSPDVDYEIGSLGEQFDLVLFLGVLYHLRHPLLALDLLYECAVRDKLVFQAMQRGSSTAQAVERDYPSRSRKSFAARDFPRCISSNTATQETPQTGGFRMPPARRRC